MKRILCLIAIGMMSLGMTAQAAMVYGTVVDGDGVAVEAAHVSLRLDGVCVTVDTNVDGYYEFLDVADGEGYTVKARLETVGNATSEPFDIEGEDYEVPELVLGTGTGNQHQHQHRSKFQSQQQGSGE